MGSYVVNCEYVPTDGAPPYSDEELTPFAEAVSSALAEHEGTAHGVGERLLVAVELEAENERSASAEWISSSRASSVPGSGPTGWEWSRSRWPPRPLTSLAQVVPLGQEPGPLVEASDLLPAELVHQGLEGRVRRQDREPGEPLVLRGSASHLVGQVQEPPGVGHRTPESH